MKRALLVIDVQNEYFAGGKLPVSHPADSLENISLAIQAAQRSKIPVIVIQHTAKDPQSPFFIKGSTGWELHSAIKAQQVDHLIEKHYPGSFTGTDLEVWLREHGINTVVISGYMTQVCCDTTSRQAFHLGHKVEFLSDATGTLGFSNHAGSVTAEELHRAILVTQASFFSKVQTTQEWIASLE